MGGVMTRAEVTRGFEAITTFDTHHVRTIYVKFQELCDVPALWERSFDELLGCFKTPESSYKAFHILDTDGNGLVDAREMLGALTVMSKGHLSERMTLLFDVFDLNREKEMAFDECFMMIRRTLAGLKKIADIHAPPEKVIHNMAKQIWKQARKHRDVRISNTDWFSWWSSDAACRNGLKMFVWKPEEQRGLPTPDHFVNVDYTKGTVDDPNPATARMSMVMAATGSMAFSPVPTGSAGGSRPASGKKSQTLPAIEHERKPRRISSFSARVDQAGNVSRPVTAEEEPLPSGSRSGSKRDSLQVPPIR